MVVDPLKAYTQVDVLNDANDIATLVLWVDTAEPRRDPWHYFAHGDEGDHRSVNAIELYLHELEGTVSIQSLN
jgi:hypothetical protein